MKKNLNFGKCLKLGISINNKIAEVKNKQSVYVDYNLIMTQIFPYSNDESNNSSNWEISLL